MCDFLEEMMGFSDALIPRAREHLPLFDPAMVGVDTLESDDTSDGEGTSHFLSQALQGSPGYTIPRTRSKTKSDLRYSKSDTEKTPSQKLRLTQGEPINTITDTINRNSHEYAPGDLVYAHKGRKVPCWFPGVLTEKGKKGMFKVDFFAGLGEEFCATASLMPFVDFETRKKEGNNPKLFDIPKKFELPYENALVLASKHTK
jgi:hypothetical protein